MRHFKHYLLMKSPIELYPFTANAAAKEFLFIINNNSRRNKKVNFKYVFGLQKIT